MYEGDMRRYWRKEVIMCHGSNCRRHAESLAALPEPVAKRTHEDEGRDDVQAESCQKGDNDVPEDGVRK